MGKVIYHHNNSGGGDWLNREQMDDLVKAGWTMTTWGPKYQAQVGSTDGSPYSAEKSGFASLRDGINEWRSVTSENPAELGCSCCGPPHSFEYEDEETGKSDYWSPSYPQYGAEDW